MEIIYKTEDGKEFLDKDMAIKYESLKRETFTQTVKEEYKVIAPSELKSIFEIGHVDYMQFYLRDCEDGSIELDGDYETCNLDDTGHLHCTDLSHGLLEWDEKEQSYFRIKHGYSWKVELIGIKSVHYW